MSSICLNMAAIDRIVSESEPNREARIEEIVKIVDEHVEIVEKGRVLEVGRLHAEIARLRRLHEESTHAAGHAQRVAQRATSLLEDKRVEKRIDIAVAIICSPQSQNFPTLAGVYAYADKIIEAGGLGPEKGTRS